MTEKLVAKAHTNDSMKAQSKLTTVAGRRRRIISDPPLIEPIEEIFANERAAALYEQIRVVLGNTCAPCNPTASIWSSTSRCSRWPARWSGSAASAPAAGSC